MAMKNPNGYGTVVKLSGNRRRPFTARKTTGMKDNGHPIISTIGYYATREEAMIALAQYNHAPYDLKKYTFKDVFDLLEKERFPKMSDSLVAQHRTSYTYCTDLLTKPFVNIKQHEFQNIIDNCGKGHSTQKMIRNFLCTMDRLAYDRDIVVKMRTMNLTVEQGETQIVREVFTHEEVEKLWEHQGEPFVDETLFCLYTGCRASEMVKMLNADVDLEQGIMHGGVKTTAGKNRVIPIHSRLRPIIERHLSDDDYLFPFKRSTKSKNPEISAISRYEYGFKITMEKLGMSHRTHDCRHSFRTKMDGANKRCTDLIMGHKTGDVGERVYTHKTIEELKQAIEFLRY